MKALRTPKFGKTSAADVFDTWHTYAVEWLPEGMRFFVDDGGGQQH